MAQQGTFSWVDLMAKDLEEAKAFYADLFGWTHTDDVSDMGPYATFASDGAPVAGGGGMSADMLEQGFPAMWNSYVTVADLDSAVGRAVELGGSVMMPPMQIADAGRMAVITGPGGESLSLWEEGQMTGAAKFNEPVSLIWNELGAKNADEAREFYGALFGWSAAEGPMGPDGTDVYTTFSMGERPAAGMYDQTGLAPEDAPAFWYVYFKVADVEATVAKAIGLGGQQIAGPIDVPDVGRMYLLQDPQGAVFYVMT